MSESRLAHERCIFRAIGHIEASEDNTDLSTGMPFPPAVVLQVLQIGLNHGMHVPHLRHEIVFALHDVIENFVERSGGGDELSRFARVRRVQHALDCRSGRMRRSTCSLRRLRQPKERHPERERRDTTSAKQITKNAEPKRTIRIRTFWEWITLTGK